MGVRIRNGNSISEGIKRIKGIESSYFKFPISFKYEDEIINMMTPFEIAKGVYSAEALSKRFGKQCVIGLLSKLEKSDHEATVEKVAPSINICNQKNKVVGVRTYRRNRRRLFSKFSVLRCNRKEIKE